MGATGGGGGGRGGGGPVLRGGRVGANGQIQTTTSRTRGVIRPGEEMVSGSGMTVGTRSGLRRTSIRTRRRGSNERGRQR